MIQLDINLSTVLVWLGAILTVIGLAFAIMAQVTSTRAGKMLDQLQTAVRELNSGALSQILAQQSMAFEASVKAPGGQEVPGSSTAGEGNVTFSSSSSASTTAEN